MRHLASLVKDGRVHYAVVDDETGQMVPFAESDEMRRIRRRAVAVTPEHPALNDRIADQRLIADVVER